MRLESKFSLIAIVVLLQGLMALELEAVTCTQTVARHYIQMLQRSREELVVELRRLSFNNEGFELPPEAKEYWADPELSKTYIQERELEDRIWRQLYFTKNLTPDPKWIAEATDREAYARVVARMFSRDQARIKELKQKLREAQTRHQTARDSLGDARDREELAFSKSMLEEEERVVQGFTIILEAIEDVTPHHSDQNKLHEIKTRLRRSIERASEFGSALARSSSSDPDLELAFHKAIQEVEAHTDLLNELSAKQKKWREIKDQGLTGNLYYFENYNERETARRLDQNQRAREWVAQHPLQLPRIRDISGSDGDYTSWSFHFGRQMIANSKGYAELIRRRISEIDLAAASNPSLTSMGRLERQFYAEMLQIVEGKVVPNFGTSIEDVESILRGGGASADCRREVYFRLKLIEDEILKHGERPDLKEQRKFYELVAALNAQVLNK